MKPSDSNTRVTWLREALARAQASLCSLEDISGRSAIIRAPKPDPPSAVARRAVVPSGQQHFLRVPSPDAQHLEPEAKISEIGETSEGILCHHKVWEGESIILHYIFPPSLSQRVGPGPCTSLRGLRPFLLSGSLIARAPKDAAPRSATLPKATTSSAASR
jgi:hypothetical protein